MRFIILPLFLIGIYTAARGQNDDMYKTKEDQERQAKSHLDSIKKNLKSTFDTGSAQKDADSLLKREKEKDETGTNVSDDPASLGEGLYKIDVGKEEFDSKAKEAQANDKTGNVNKIINSTSREFERQDPNRTEFKSADAIGNAAHDLLGKPDECKDVPIGDKMKEVVKDEFCLYKELSDYKTYKCTRTINTGCAGLPAPLDITGNTLTHRTTTVGTSFKGRISKADKFDLNPITEMLTVYIPDVRKVSQFDLYIRSFEDQIEVKVNGTWVFKGIGGNFHYPNTSNQAAVPNWEYKDERVGGGGGGGGGGVNPGQGGSIKSVGTRRTRRVFANYGFIDGPSVPLNLKNWLVNGHNYIYIPLGIYGSTNIDLSFYTHVLCELSDTETTSCENPGQIEDVKKVGNTVCTEGPSYKNVGGQNVWKDCWQQVDTYGGYTPIRTVYDDKCSSFVSGLRTGNNQCREDSRVCTLKNDRFCIAGRINFKCTTLVPETTVQVCGKNFMCPDGNCVEDQISKAEAPDYESINKLNEADGNADQGMNDLRLFSGKPLTCGKTDIFGKGVVTNCCNMTGVAVGASCMKPDEKNLEIARKNNLAIYMGINWSSKVSEFEKIRYEGWCSYESMLGKLVAEAVVNQANQLNPRPDFGGPKNVNCSFIVPEHLNQINWEKVDFTPFKNSFEIILNANKSVKEPPSKQKGKTDEFTKDTPYEKMIEKKIKDRFQIEDKK